ncbi:DUF5819 family protein [Streptomyces sp. NPDC002004]
MDAYDEGADARAGAGEPVAPPPSTDRAVPSPGSTDRAVSPPGSLDGPGDDATVAPRDGRADAHDDLGSGPATAAPDEDHTTGPVRGASGDGASRDEVSGDEASRDGATEPGGGHPVDPAPDVSAVSDVSAPATSAAPGTSAVPDISAVPDASVVPEVSAAPAAPAVPDPPGTPWPPGPPGQPREPSGPPGLPLPPASDGPRALGIAGLSLPYQVPAALALAVVAVLACVHLGMVFLHVAPANTLTKQHGQAVDAWVYPEFEQNWKLFAPNPLQQNISVEVRADERTGDGSFRTTGWVDLSAQDGAAIDGNPLPSHTQQNELRRAWDFYAASHDTQNRPAGLRGELSERYLRRIALLRLERQPGARDVVIERVQVRTRTTNVRPPAWSGEKADTRPLFRELPWWSVTAGDVPLRSAKEAGAR